MTKENMKNCLSALEVTIRMYKSRFDTTKPIEKLDGISQIYKGERDLYIDTFEEVAVEYKQIFGEEIVHEPF